MKTHIHLGDKRCIALLSIFATLCSVYALALAYRLSATAELLRAAVIRSTDVTWQVGDMGITRSDLRSYQLPRNRRILQRQQMKVQHTAAPTR